MANRKGNFKIALAVFVITSLIACSKSGFSSGTANNSVTPVIPPGGGGTTCSATNTVSVNASYAGLSNASMTVSLQSSSDSKYSGSVSLSYSAGGQQYSAYYSAPSGNNVSIGGLYDNGTETAAYNYFYNGGQNFSGFFQDAAGALVLSVQAVDSNGCAAGNIYFMNFVQTGATQSPFRECWFIYKGPYDCGDSNIINKTSLQPGGQYQLIGTFSGLPVSQAFQ